MGPSQSFSFGAEDADICGVDEADRRMRRLHRRYPQYGFDQNFGYATAEHLRALETFGPCAIHRATFAPVREAGAEQHAR